MSQQEDHVLYTRNEWTNVDVFKKIIQYLKTKDIRSFADVGSNVGEVSKILLEELSSLEKVYCYEPESSNFNFLQTRFASDPRIFPVKKALFYGNKTGDICANGWCGSHTLAKNTGVIVETVELTTIEDENLDTVDLIKIDIEGSEYNVISKSPRLKNVKYIVIEFHPFGMPDSSFYDKLPSPQDRQNRVDYIKQYTDKFVSENLPNHRIVIGIEEQYLLEKVD